MKIVILTSLNFAPPVIHLAAALKRKGHTVKVIKDRNGEGDQVDLVLSDFSDTRPISIQERIKNNSVRNSYSRRLLTPVQKVVDAADVIIQKDDLPIYNEWNFIKIPEDKILISLVGGARFRKATPEKIQEFLKFTTHRVAITPDLNYPALHGIYLPACIDSRKQDNTWHPRGVPFILHTPSNRKVKGTDDIFAPAMEILLAKGYEFNYKIVANHSRHDVVQMKKEATIFFDQAKAGFYGMSALEAMQFGIPTVCYVSSQALVQSNGKVTLTKCPVRMCGNTIESVVKTFERLLSNPEKLSDISKRTKKFCDEFHSYEAVAEMWNELLSGKVKKNYKNKMKFITQPNATHFARPYLDQIKKKVEVITHDAGRCVDDAEVLWIEWANGLAGNIFKKSFTGKTLLRIHDWEVQSGVITKINFDNVDLLWFINRDARMDFFNRFPLLAGKPAFWLPNAVDVSKFKIADNKQMTKKIAAVSIDMKPRKRYDRLIEFFKLLCEKDDGWELHIRCNPMLSTFPSDEYLVCEQQIIEYGLQDKVFIEQHNLDFDKIDDKQDLVEWFADKSFIASFSEHEGFHYAIAEGMLCGLLPIVYDWEWGRAKDFWSGAHRDMERLVSEVLLRFIKDHLNLVPKARKLVIDRFSSSHLIKKLDYRLYAEKKIMFVLHHHPYKWEPRGGEQSMQIIIEYFTALGYDVSCLVCNVKNKIEETETINGVKYQVYTRENFDNALSAAMKIEDPQCVVSYGRPAEAAAKSCMKLGIPYVVLVRWWRNVQPTPVGDISKDWNEDFINRNHTLFNFADSVITNNDWAANLLSSMYGICADRSYVPYVGPVGGTGNKHGKIVIPTIGKDLDGEAFILRLAKAMPSEQFLAINVPSGFNFIVETDDPNAKVDWPENLECRSYAEDMEAIWKETKILLYPVYKNDVCGTGRVCIEAMAHGIPVIVNDRSGIGEIGQLVIHRDAGINDWATKIMRVDHSYKKRSAEMLTAARKYDTYSQLDVIVNAVDDAIEGVKK
jgi:glycosyltransferase involved in cell wall biosynthesis